MKALLVSLVTFLFCIVLVQAQDDNVIAYGQTVHGEISVQDYETHYSFQGNGGDIIRAVLTPSNGTFGWSSWYQPEVILLDSEMNVILALHAHEYAALIHELQESGEYHLIATGWGGRTDDNVGKFDLHLDQVPLLPESTVTTCEASTELPLHYAVRADGDFSIAYEHTAGKFYPEVSVNVIASNPFQCSLDNNSCYSDSSGANLHDVALLGGLWLQSGTMNVKPDSSRTDLYIVQVGKREWEHYDQKKTAKFTLELSATDS